MRSVVSLFVDEVQRMMEKMIISIHQENFGRWEREGERGREREREKGRGKVGERGREGGGREERGGGGREEGVEVFFIS